jgi:outer membrane biosynthesis protein TonB
MKESQSSPERAVTTCTALPFVLVSLLMYNNPQRVTERDSAVTPNGHDKLYSGEFRLDSKPSPVAPKPTRVTPEPDPEPDPETKPKPKPKPKPIPRVLGDWEHLFE